METTKIYPSRWRRAYNFLIDYRNNLLDNKKILDAMLIKNLETDLFSEMPDSDWTNGDIGLFIEEFASIIDDKEAVRNLKLSFLM